MKKIQFLTALFVMMVLTATDASAQVNDVNELATLIENKQLVFSPRTVTPQRGGSRTLDPRGYDLVLKGDTAISFLPYFGRAYAGVPYSDNDGIQFTSTDYSYTYKKSKKGWKITIKPNDVYGINVLYLDVLNNGNATLQVNSNNRDGISFFGVIEKQRN